MSFVPLIDETHDEAAKSWIDSANGDSPFVIQNLPFGIFSTGGKKRGGVAIGDFIFDLASASGAGLFNGDAQVAARAAAGESLNALLALTPVHRRALRRQVFALLHRDAQGLESLQVHLHAQKDAVMHLPAMIGDYTDFYAGIYHAQNVGALFRPDAPLLPNYKYVPIGYHGRASSVVVSGTDIHRPSGQRLLPGQNVPEFGPCTRLDYELELGIWIGGENGLGESVSIDDAADRIAGICLLNDWSARDFQTWEYQPLGPFLAKSFATSISPWIITAEALAPYRVAQPPRPEGDPAPLPYLLGEDDQRFGAFALQLATFVRTAAMASAHPLGQGPATNLYWTAAQMLTHHASNGCNLRPGDLLGTGTISTPDASGYGSLLEQTKGGRNPVVLGNGESRGFLQDGDEVIFTAHAAAPGRVTIGFGDCRGVILPPN